MYSVFLAFLLSLRLLESQSSQPAAQPTSTSPGYSQSSSTASSQSTSTSPGYTEPSGTSADQQTSTAPGQPQTADNRGHSSDSHSQSTAYIKENSSGWIEGSIKKGKRRVDGATVTLRDPSTGYARSAISKKGRFEFPHVAPHDWVVEMVYGDQKQERTASVEKNKKVTLDFTLDDSNEKKRP
jgi:hypothetical protein